MPFPGSFVLDAKGVITGKYFEDDFRERYTSADILGRQFGVRPDAARSEVEGKQLKLEAAASNLLVGAGQRVSLTLEIEMKPNMHVYAPGVEENYIPINWKMKESGVAPRTKSAIRRLKNCTWRPLTKRCRCIAIISG